MNRLQQMELRSPSDGLASPVISPLLTKMPRPSSHTLVFPPWNPFWHVPLFSIFMPFKVFLKQAPRDNMCRGYDALVLKETKADRS